MKKTRYVCFMFICIIICGFPKSVNAVDFIEPRKVEFTERRATGEYNFEIPAHTLKEASSSFPLDYGETVTITASYSPSTASVDFGLIDEDDIFFPIRASNGTINQTIRIDLSGNYTFAVRNNSNYTVRVTGFINY